MSINQQRVIALSNAATITLKALHRIRKYAKDQSTQSLPITEAYAFLVDYIFNDDLLFPPEDDVFPSDFPGTTYTKVLNVIQTEYTHFSKFAAHNDRTAERLRAYRDRVNPNRRRRSQKSSTFTSVIFDEAPLKSHTPIAPIVVKEEPKAPAIEYTMTEENFQTLYEIFKGEDRMCLESECARCGLNDKNETFCPVKDKSLICPSNRDRGDFSFG